MIIDAHVHLITGTPGNEYFPSRYRLDRSFIWAYSGASKWTKGYERDPMDLFPRMEQRVADPDGTATVAALDKAGVDAADAFYVGDVYPIDVVGAARVGMVPVLMDPLGRYGDRGCRTARDVPAFCRQLVPLQDAA